MLINLKSATVLGIYTSYADAFHEVEIINVDELDSPLALIPARHQSTGKDLWISVSFDHVCIENWCAKCVSTDDGHVNWYRFLQSRKRNG